MKVYKTYKDFSRACDTWNKYHEGLDWEGFKEGVLVPGDFHSWNGYTIGEKIESLEHVATFFSFTEAMRWINAYWFCDYRYEGTFEEYDDFEVVP